MSSRSRQAGALRRCGLAALPFLVLALGSCQSRNGPEVTGSIGPASAAQVEALGRRVDANPGDAEASIAYAQALRARGQTAQALAVLQQATLRSPDNTAILAAYGKVLADAGRWKEASDVLARAHRPERPDWRILSVQGTVADQLGDFSSAQRYYEAALRIAPGEPSILSNQGLSYALARRLPEAERILKEASGHPRADARVRQNLALVLGLEGRFAEAEATLKRDMSAAEAAENVTAIRRMVSQSNSWKSLRQGEAAPPGKPLAIPPGNRQAAG